MGAVKKRGQIDPLFGVVFLIMLLLMIAQSQQLTEDNAEEHGKVGSIAYQLQRSFDMIFGQQKITCPFISRSSMATLWKEECYTLSDIENCPSGYTCVGCRQGDRCFIRKYEVGTENYEDRDCKLAYEESGDWYVTNYEVSCSELFNPQGSVFLGYGVQGDFIECHTNYTYENANYHIHGTFPEEKITGDLSEQTVESYKFMRQRMPSWQCFIIFGALPFIILYHLFFDLLSFTFFSHTTKRWIAITVSMMAVSMGLLGNLVAQLNEITNLGAGASFLSLIFSLGLLSALFSQISGLLSSTADMRAGLVEATDGIEAMRSINRSLRRGGGSK